MFAVIVAGRPPLVEFTQVDETHVLFSLTNPEGINHIVVFMTGLIPFPEGYAGAVYLSLPSAAGEERAWLYLGFISNSKPSALFKVCKFNAASDGSAMKGSMLNSVLPVSGVAQLGVSVELETSVISQTPVPGATPTNLDSFVVYTQKMLESFFNYAASFAVKPDTALLSSSDSYVPISVLQRCMDTPLILEDVQGYAYTVPQECSAKPKIKVVEFFAGIGGMHMALKESRINYEVVAAYEVNDMCCQVYDMNFGRGIVKRRNIESITGNELSRLDASLWTMSPPCQPFTRVKEHGIRDTYDCRVNPLLHILNLLMELSNAPRWILLENVPEFRSSSTYERLKTVLDNLNYRRTEFLVDSSDFGVPNTRKRFYLLADHSCSAALGNCQPSDPSLNGVRKWLTKPLRLYIDANASAPIPEQRLLQYVYNTDIVDGTSLRSCCFTKAYGRYIKGAGPIFKENDTVQTMEMLRRLQFCVSTDEKLKLIKAADVRLFSPNEIKRILGFPDSFQFPDNCTNRQRYQMLGNSVSIIVTSNLMRLLLQH